MTEQRQAEDLFPPDEERPDREAEKSASPGKKPAGTLMISMGMVALVFAFALGTALRRNTTLFLEKRSVDGYLPAEEYVLVNQDGKPVQALRTLNYRTLHSWDQGGTLKTSRGIGENASWEEFCQAYGDMHARYITIFRHENASDRFDYSNLIFLSDPMTVQQFQKEYVDTGIVSPDRDSINVTFSAYTDGTRLWYTDAELSEAVSQYYSQSWFEQTVRRSPSSRSYSLDFYFQPGRGISCILSTGP